MAAAAAVARVHPSPPPPARRTVARLECARLAWVAADAVVCLFLASMWLLFWGLATAQIGRLAGGKDGAVFNAAFMVVSVAGVTLVLLLPFGVLLLALVMARTLEAATATTDIEATKEPVLKTCGAEMRDDPVSLWLLASLAFSLLVLIGFLVKGLSPVMGSRRERMRCDLLRGSIGQERGGLLCCLPHCDNADLEGLEDGATCSVMCYAVETKP